MKNLLFKLAMLMVPVTMIFSFYSCSDDDDVDEVQYPTNILTFVFEDAEYIASQPVIDQEAGTIKFVVNSDAPKEELLLTPTITISSDCTVSPASGEEVDFAGEGVVYTVSSTLSKDSKNYTVSYTRNAYSDAAILELRFEDEVVIDRDNIVIPEEGTDIVFHVASSAEQSQLKALTPVFTVSEGAVVVFDGTVVEEGDTFDFSGDPLLFTVVSENGENETEYTIGAVILNGDALIQSLVIEDPDGIVVLQPEFTELDFDIVFYIDDEATVDQIANLYPVITLPVGAVMTEIPDRPFAGAEAVEFTVTSEDETESNDYTIRYMRANSVAYDFEEWETKRYLLVSWLAPTGWATNNEAMANYSSSYRNTHGWSITRSEDSRSGYALKLETNESLNPGGLAASQVPGVTAASVYLGDFSALRGIGGDSMQTTHFGVEYAHNPLKVTGYYKYTPGPVFYNNKEIDPSGRADMMAVTAVLFEKSEENNWLDGSQINDNSDKIVAFGQFTSGEEVTEYKFFEVNFDWKDGRSYDPEQEYMISIVFSSSADGANFNAAPESQLYIDDVKLYYLD